MAEVVELAYQGSSRGEWGLRLSDLAMDQIVNTIGYHINPVLPASGIHGSHLILIMFIVRMVQMFLDIAVNAVVIAQVHGCGF